MLMLNQSETTGAERYFRAVEETLQRVWNTQQEPMQAACDAVASCIRAGRSVYVFGCSHAGILAEEVFYRTGGLAILNPILFPGFSLSTRPITMTSQLERLPGLGKILVEQNRLAEGDVLILHSVSGRNTVPVEMALEAAGRGVTVIAITNLSYSRSVTSRHAGGKRLFEVCPIVIDNCGTVGDAAISLQGLPEPIGPTSTAVGAALLNAVVISVVERLLTEHAVPPVFLSANLDGGDEHNRRIFEEYKDRIFYN